MKLEKLCVLSLLFMAANLMTTSLVVSADSSLEYRQKNGLQAYVPPDWFLSGYFIASEKNPRYIFGPVREFVGALGGATTWLIEDMELERLEAASADGKKIEYSLFLEAVSPDRAEYFVFVMLPYESTQAWYDAKRAFHGRKADKYYGKTKNELEHALRQGLNIKAELRFWIENGETSLQTPEDVIMSKYTYRPVFDLTTGDRPESSSKAE